MIRALLGLVAVASLGGCGPDCGQPDQVNGTYAVFANVVEEPQVTNAEHFPSYMTPANGWSEWTVQWNLVDPSQVAVTIDEQPYQATATWDDVECGNFRLTFAGDYVSINDTEHAFSVDGQFVVFGGHLEGLWSWSETWTSRDGEHGTFSSLGQMSGTRVSE